MAHHYRYWAFISYSHRDRQVAARLHARIEGYRVPRRLVGLDGPRGPVPERLKPVFRDHDELEAGGHLGPRVRQALEVSRSLVVLCSPAAALSHWVDAEVAEFERLQPEAPLFCVIVAGEPLAGDARECLPQGLRGRFAAANDATLNQSAPIAVDLRPGGDGWLRAVRMIVAGLTGLPLDQLVQRDAQRRHRRVALAALALGLVAVALGMLAVFALRARDEARRQRAQAEGLVEFMLVDLRKRLEPHGRLDALDAVGARALRYYDTQPPRALDPDALGRRARALHLIGEISDRRGDTRRARTAFASARSSTAELLARDPEDPQRLYDHAQSVFWTGYIDWQYGDAAGARRAFEEYGRLARRLSAKDPANPDWLAEVGYAHSNMGTLLMEQGQAAGAIPEFAESLRIDRRRAMLRAGDDQVQLDIAQDRSWLSSALYADRQLRPAIAERRIELDIYGRLLRANPGDVQVAGRQLAALGFLGRMYFAAGDPASAQRAADAALQVADELRRNDAANVEWRESEAKLLVLASQLAGEAGRLPDAERSIAAAEALLASQLERDPESWTWRVEQQEAIRLQRATLYLLQGRAAAAEADLAASQRRLDELRAEGNAGNRVLALLATAACLQARNAELAGNHDLAGRHWRRLAELTRREGAFDGEIVSLRALALERTGHAEQARHLRDALSVAGFARAGSERALTTTTRRD